MIHEDASNLLNDNYGYSKLKELRRKIKVLRHTMSAAMDCSIVSISIKAIFRSFSKNLKRFIVPY